MSSEELRAIAHDDPKYLEASRNELAMRQIAADARIRDLERQLDTSNAKNACKDVEIKALNDKLEASTKKATRLKSKYQNSQLASGDIFEWRKYKGVSPIYRIIYLKLIHFGLRFCVLCLRVVVYRFKGKAGFLSFGGECCV